MRQVLLFSILLLAGLATSQFLPLAFSRSDAFEPALNLALLTALGFIMLRVGLEFDIDKSRLRSYGMDYLVAASAAALPWLFCAAYFTVFLYGQGGWKSGEAWREALLGARFAAPTSAGVLFSMLAAAGLAATWLFKKARILAIFDDLDTVLLIIPLKMVIIGFHWELILVVAGMVVQLWLAWRYLGRLALPASGIWLILYATAIALASEGIYLWTRNMETVLPVHIEVLLPAFALGCMLRRHVGVEPLSEKRLALIVAALFMLLVGLSMPALVPYARSAGEAISELRHELPWGLVALHVIAITLLSNLGKMLPVFMYRSEAGWRERLALCIALWPRGEVGAGVLVISLGYGLARLPFVVALLSLALNLMLTGVFILLVKYLVRPAPPPEKPPALLRPALA